MTCMTKILELAVSFSTKSIGWVGLREPIICHGKKIASGRCLENLFPEDCFKGMG